MKYVFFILTLCTFQTLNGQVEKVDVRYKTFGIQGRVVDSTGRAGVPYAHVRFIQGKDTAVLACDAMGRFSWMVERVAEVVEVRVTAIGFKPFMGRYSPKQHGTFIRIRMKQDVVALNEVIITRKKIYMIVKGDTLEYKAETFKTLEGDFIGRLLQKLPGVSLDHGSLTVNGQPISRVYVNGSDSLFGGKLAGVLANIEADNVKDIQVYDERNKEDQAKGLKYGRRETVMNVTTKRNVTRREVRNNSLIVGVGLDASQEPTSRFKEKLLLGVKYVIPKVRLNVTGNYSNIPNPAGNDLQKSDFKVSYSTPRHKRDFSYCTINTFSSNKTYTRELNERFYFPTEDYESRIYESNSASKRNSYNFNTRHDFALFGKWATIAWGLAFEGDGYKFNRENQERFEINNTFETGANVRNYSGRENFKGSGNFSVSKRLPDKKSGIGVGSSFSLQKGKSKAWQMDTLAESRRRFYTSGNYDECQLNWGGNIGYNKTLSLLWSMGVDYSYTYSDEEGKGERVNRLTEQLDTNGTRDYSFYKQTHRVSGNVECFTKKTMFKASMAIGHVERDHVERFPELMEHRDRFLLLEGMCLLDKKCSATFNWNLKYNVIPRIPDISHMRNEIRDANPLFLSSGNPNLKPEELHDFTLKANKVFVQKASNIGVSVVYKLVRNYIARNHHYFSEATYLPEYDYTVFAGATLEIPENTKPSHDFSINMDYAKQSGWLESKLSVRLSFYYSKTPSFLEGRTNDLITDGGVFHWSMLSGFSRKVEFLLSSRTLLSRSRSDLDKASNILTEGASFGLRTTIIPKFNISGTFSYDYTKNYATEIENDQTNLKAEISRNLGKYLAVKLEGINLLDRKSGVQLFKTADYNARNERACTGRYVMLTLTQKLK